MHHQGRLDRRGSDGRSQRLHPDARSRVALPADVRQPTAKSLTASSVVFSSKAAGGFGARQKKLGIDKKLYAV